MAGHSQFKNIMYRKGAQDKKRSKLFSKLSREITIAAKFGGPSPDSNARLRLAIQNARGQSMPKDNIERAIKKSEQSDADNFEEMRYEGYGPGGVALIVEALSDNRNRTASAVRATFAKNGGNLGETGAVSFMFDRVGEVSFGGDAGDADTVFEAAIEAGADDVNSTDESHVISCSFESLGDVAAALENTLGQPESVNAIWRPQTMTPVDEDKAATLLKLIALLEDDDDVQSVYANFEVSEEVLAKLTAA